MFAPGPRFALLVCAICIGGFLPVRSAYAPDMGYDLTTRKFPVAITLRNGEFVETAILEILRQAKTPESFANVWIRAETHKVPIHEFQSGSVEAMSALLLDFDNYFLGGGSVKVIGKQQLAGFRGQIAKDLQGNPDIKLLHPAPNPEQSLAILQVMFRVKGILEWNGQGHELSFYVDCRLLEPADEGMMVAWKREFAELEEKYRAFLNFDVHRSWIQVALKNPWNGGVEMPDLSWGPLFHSNRIAAVRNRRLGDGATVGDLLTCSHLRRLAEGKLRNEFPSQN